MDGDDGELLASIGSSPEELDAFKAIKARLQERGLGVRCRPRKGVAHTPQGIVHKDGFKK